MKAKAPVSQIRAYGANRGTFEFTEYFRSAHGLNRQGGQQIAFHVPATGANTNCEKTPRPCRIHLLKRRLFSAALLAAATFWAVEPDEYPEQHMT